MTAPNDNNEALVAAAMNRLLQFGVTPRTGFLARVPWAMRLYVEQFLACGKLCRLKEPATLVQNCIVMARTGAAFHGENWPGPDLLALADLLVQYQEEAAAYARKWEAEIIRENGGAT